MMLDQQPALDRRLVITALGIAQILAWGTSFYFPAVFAEPIVRDTGWSLGYVIGGTSIGLLVAGLISPQVGRVIDRHGGQPVLLASSLFYSAGLIGVGLAPALPVYLLAWALIGIGMGTGLYDSVFAALGRLYGSGARGPITNLTLFGGFASTICWPLSAFMIDHVGWRIACFVYAGLHLFVRKYNKLIDEYVHNSCTSITFATAFGPSFLKLTREAWQAEIDKAPLKRRAEAKRDVIEQGLDSLYVVEALGHFQKLISWMAEDLKSGPYLASNTFSNADCAVIPYILRLELIKL